MSPAGAPAGDRSTGARFAACVAETVPATATAAASELVDYVEQRKVAQAKRLRAPKIRCHGPTCAACHRLRARPPCRRCQVGGPAQSALISELTLTTDSSSRCTGCGWRFRTWRCVSAESLRAGAFPAPCGVQLTSFLPVKEAQVHGTVGTAALVVSPAARNVARAPARYA